MAELPLSGSKMTQTDDNIPVILRRKDPLQKEEALEVKLHQIKEDRHYYSQEQVGIDKIVEDSGSQFYITGKKVKIRLMDLLNLVEKHDTAEVQGMEDEEVVVSSALLTRIATAEILDEEEEKLKLFDATAVGLFISAGLLSLFALTTKTLADIKTFAWIILGISGFFLLHFFYRGIKSGEVRSLMKTWLRNAGKD